MIENSLMIELHHKPRVSVPKPMGHKHSICVWPQFDAAALQVRMGHQVVTVDLTADEAIALARQLQKIIGARAA